MIDVILPASLLIALAVSLVWLVYSEWRKNWPVIVGLFIALAGAGVVNQLTTAVAPEYPSVSAPAPVN